MSTIAQNIIDSTSNIMNQFHGPKSVFKHYAPLFRSFAEQELPFMLVKRMATPQRNCSVSPQVSFFATKDELISASVEYRANTIREEGLDVMFVDMFEWDLGINYIKP